MTKRIRGGIKEKNYKIKYIFMREKEKEVYVKERWKSQYPQPYNSPLFPCATLQGTPHP